MIKRIVALKTIRVDQLAGENAESVIARFRREAQAAGRLNHPNIVAIYDIGEEAGTWYIAMEFVQGRELKEYFEANERFSAADIVKIMTQMLDALGYSHKLGVIHRDIKPANLLLDMQGTIWITDFGLAKADDQQALTQSGGIVVVKGNLAPNGAVLKPSAATPALMQHRGRAVVFEDIDDYKARINDEDLDIDETCVMVLKNCGPKGYPGMAEVGNMGLPPKVLEKGIKDMVRISDARMSGTAYGTVVLHTAPEAATGGPLALVQNGDMIELDVAGRRLHLDVSDAELARRRAAWKPPVQNFKNGYQKLYVDHVMQADKGADLELLITRFDLDDDDGNGLHDIEPLVPALPLPFLSWIVMAAASPTCIPVGPAG